MRFAKLALLAALTVVLRSADAAAQAPESPVLSAPFDHRLLVADAEQRATLAGATQPVPLRADGWNLYEASNYMGWGMLAGGVVGLVVGGATARKDLTGPVGLIMGGIIGMGVGGGAGLALYTVRKL